MAGRMKRIFKAPVRNDDLLMEVNQNGVRDEKDTLNDSISSVDSDDFVANITGAISSTQNNSFTDDNNGARDAEVGGDKGQEGGKKKMMYRAAMSKLISRESTTGSSMLVSTESQLGPTTSATDTNTLVACLSQPPAGLSHKERLQWLQERRAVGLWVQCNDCEKWRYLPDTHDPLDCPKKWYCSNNPDSNYNNCEIAQQAMSLALEEDLIQNKYNAGSIVWAKVTGYPWWPAMVDDCPDTEQYYWLESFHDSPTDYNVVFFDTATVTRAWIPAAQLKPFATNPDLDHELRERVHSKYRMNVAKKSARDALKLTVRERLKKYSFLTLWPGEIISPPEYDTDDSDTSAGDANRKKRVHKKKDTARKRFRRITSINE